VPINAAKKLLLNLPRFVKRGLVMYFDVLICAFSVWLALGLRLDQWGHFQGNQWVLLIAAIGFSLPLFISFGLYRAIFRYVGTAAFLNVTRVFVIYTSITMSMLYG
jgi:FlaA1/EpsC-like NDP-sugar epimerase